MLTPEEYLSNALQQSKGKGLEMREIALEALRASQRDALDEQSEMLTKSAEFVQKQTKKLDEIMEAVSKLTPGYGSSL